MSIQQGEKALKTDINGIYSTFNSFISTFGGTITQLTLPGDLIDDTDVNHLNSKIGEFQMDTYLSTQPTWWVTAASVNEGDLIEPFSFDTTINNMGLVQCRNDAYHSHEVNSHSTNSNDTNTHQKHSNTTRGHDNKSHTGRSYDFNSQGRNGNGSNQLGTCSNNKKGNGNMGNGTCSNGNNSNVDKSNTDCTANGTCSHTSKKNTTYIDITNNYKNDGEDVT